MNEIDKRLKDISKIIDIDYLLNEQNTEEIVKSYYKINKLAYRVFHNKEGYLHMGISSSGKYSNNDLEVPLLEIEKYIKEGKVEKVLELASGHGANTIFLADRNPQVEFFAVDLSTKPKRKFYRFENTNFEYGDFHNLKMYENSSFDIIFIMEALCHSNNKKKVLEEMYRLLKVDGKVIIYDGYFGREYSNINDNERKASVLTSVGMAVGEFGDLREFEKEIKISGFEIFERENLSTHIIPTVKRFEKLSSFFFWNKHIGKLLKFLLPEMFVRNSISAYLMPVLLKEKIAVYYKHVLRKE
ncbi:MAG: methyltransferase domain-containing protein [Candidatus Methanofastidiosum sp.]|nr:methyltransferase domain-containing protein [Methanofastidiosum sp.]